MLKKTTILTGFLGAGKTTYLNHLLKSNPNTKYAVIENEFGKESIDGDLIVRTPDNIIEMNNGCLCCSLNEGLYDLLNDFYLRKDEFDELIIEATGVADPAPIAEPFLTHAGVKSSFNLTNTICLVDAEQIEERLSDTEEARKQIAFSDIIIIGKTDLVTQDYVEQLKTILKGINPLAKVLVKQGNAYPTIPTSVMKEIPVVQKSTCSHHHHEHNEKCNHHHHNEKTTTTHQHTDIVTHSFVFDGLFNIDELYYQLTVLLTFQSKDLYRFKGIIYSNNAEKKVVLQSVGKRLGMENLPIEDNEATKLSKFVFIGKNIKPDGYKKLLERCKVKTQEKLV